MDIFCVYLCVWVLPLQKKKSHLFPQGFETGRGFNHEAHEGRITAYANGPYEPVELSKEEAALL